MNILLNVTKSNFDVISNDVNVRTLHDVCARRNNVISRIAFIMPPFKEEGVYCFANVGRSVGLSVRRSVGPSVDQMVTANYLGIYSPQGSHILCGE